MRTTIVWLLASLPVAVLASGGGPPVTVPDTASSMALLGAAFAGIVSLKSLIRRK